MDECLFCRCACEDGVCAEDAAEYVRQMEAVGVR